MSKKEVWGKLKEPPRKRLLITVPTHFTRNETNDGWVIEGTDTPFYPDTHVDDPLWVYADDWSPCDERN